MTEAPDIREQEDCPSPAACDARCDQHEKTTVAEILDAHATAGHDLIYWHGRRPETEGPEADIRAIIERERPTVILSVDPAQGGAVIASTIAAVQRSKGRR